MKRALLLVLALLAAGAEAQEARLRNLDSRTGCFGAGCGDAAVCTKPNREDASPQLLVCTATEQTFAASDGSVTLGTPLTITDADPGIFFDSVVPGDTDWWVAGINDAGGDDDDFLRIGDGGVFGTNTFVTIATDGKVGIGAANPNRALHVRSTVSTTHFLKLETTAPSSVAGLELLTNLADWQLRVDTAAALRVVDDVFSTTPVRVFQAAPTDSLVIDEKGDVGLGTANTNAQLTVEGVLSLDETTAPLSTAGYGKIWTEADNCLWFKDGDGVNHSIYCPAFAELSAHNFSGTTTQAITAEDAWTKIQVYNLIRGTDALGNLSASAGTDDITVGSAAAGQYDFYWGISAKSTDASRVFVFGVAVAAAVPTTITNATAATPIVITTSTAHGLMDGDGVEISGVLGVTEANGSRFVDELTATTFALYDLDKNPVAGTGVYTSGGEIDFTVLGGTIAWNSLNLTSVDDMSRSSAEELIAGDTIFAVAANTESASDINVYAAVLSVMRRSD